MTDRPLALLLSRRRAARALGIRNGEIAVLVARGLLREVPAGKGKRIPLAEVQRLAETGWTEQGAPRRARRRPCRGAASAEAVLALDLSKLAPPPAPGDPA